MVLRFAPSPTGLLHAGNARVALVNYLVARRTGQPFLLRLDDTDKARSTQAYADAALADLAWLGIIPDRMARQSDRLGRYEAAFTALQNAGRVYPCYESAEELDLKRKSQLARHRPPVYDRAALKLDAAARAALEAEGRRPHWRFRLADVPVIWTDRVQGEKRFPPGSLSDPVIIKENGEPLYAFASVVDDAELGVTLVIRGEDHVANTAVQIEMFQALGAPIPDFAHLPLLVDAAGHGLSKRLGSLSLAGLRADGIEPMALAAYLALLGTAQAIHLEPDLGALAAAFDLAQVGRAPPRFDPGDLAQLTAKYLHDLPFTQAAATGLPDGVDAPLWAAIQGNLLRRADAAAWVVIAYGDIAVPATDDPELIAAARAALPPGPWTAATFKDWSRALGAATGRKGKALFHPLRLALTGRETGPDLGALLPLIGPERVALRLAAALAGA